MKKLTWLLAATIVWIFAACTEKDTPNRITAQGIGPVKLGMEIAEIPDRAEGLYDEIAIEHKEGYFDELEGEEYPATDHYTFRLNGETMFKTEIPAGQTTVSQLTALSPALACNGIHTGLTCREAFAAGAALYSGGSIETCWFFCCFQFPEAENIQIVFDLFGDRPAFTEKGYAKFYEEIAWQRRDDVLADDFNEDATISEIRILTSEE